MNEKNNEIRVYEVGIPVNEILVFRVEASSAQEAFEKARSGEGEQICAVPGSRGFIFKVASPDEKFPVDDGG